VRCRAAVRAWLPSVLALASAAAIAQDRAPKLPRIAAEPSAFDFGKALPQRTLEKEFVIRNYGGADLKIENVTTSCGCTVARLANDVIPPGKSLPLRVALETRSILGRVERRVLIRSNDPANPRLEISLSVTVAQPR
jgi:hypothetical protein